MTKFEQEFFKRHGSVGVHAILEGWEKVKGLKAGILSTEERWERFILMTNRTNDNALSSPKPVVAALAVAAG